MKINDKFLLQQLVKCWNNLNTNHIEQYLSEDVIYESQYVLNPLVSKTEVLEYLRGKFKTIIHKMRSELILLNATIGYLPSMNMRSCIVLSQIIGDKLHQSTVLIEIKNSRISRIDICMIPEPNEVIFADLKINFN